MKLTERQAEKAIGLRELLTKQRPDGEMAYVGYIDFTRALGKMLDGVDEAQSPTEMKATFDTAWRSYARYLGAEQDRILMQTLGNDEELVNKVKEHENGRRIVHRILERVREKHGGINAEIDASRIDVTDILVEEMDGEWDDA